MAAANRSTRLDQAEVLHSAGAQLAGVRDTLRMAGERSGKTSNVLHLLADAVCEINHRICDVAAQLERSARHDGPEKSAPRRST